MLGPVGERTEQGIGGTWQESRDLSPLDSLVTDLAEGKFSFTGLSPTLIFHPTSDRICRKCLGVAGILK